MGRLSRDARARALERMAADDLDVLVIGGGVTGCGAALDAVTRGLRTGLLEARDVGAGTSSRSTKLFHGGLRYLERMDFTLVREALRERGLALRRLCPHLAHATPFVFPLTRRVWERAYVGTGVALYDAMGGLHPGVPRHRHLTRTATVRLNPSMSPAGFVGAIRYYDAGIDDARHTAVLARTAAHHGALVATRAEVTDLRWGAGRVTGVVATDLESGERLEIGARRVVNATGPWSEELQRLAGRAPATLRRSKGVHLVVDRDRLQLRTGLIMRTERSVLFVVPWQRSWLVGTTDTPWEHEAAEPLAHRGDVDYLLDRVNAVLRTPLGRADVTGVLAGLRPLVAPPVGAGPTVSLSREHAVMETAPGLLTITGGKYTTYRVMAADVVDAAVAGLDQRVPPSVTADVPLLGAPGFRARLNQRAALARRSGLHPAWVDHLLGRYGDLVDEVLELVADDATLAVPLQGAGQYLRAEVVYAATHEGALHLEDVLARRTRVAVETHDRGAAAAGEAAVLMGDALGWDTERRAREVAGYLTGVEAQRRAEREGTDGAAVRAWREVMAGTGDAGGCHTAAPWTRARSTTC